MMWARSPLQFRWTHWIRLNRLKLHIASCFGKLATSLRFAKGMAPKSKHGIINTCAFRSRRTPAPSKFSQKRKKFALVNKGGRGGGGRCRIFFHVLNMFMTFKHVLNMKSCSWTCSMFKNMKSCSRTWFMFKACLRSWTWFHVPEHDFMFQNMNSCSENMLYV